MGSFIEGIDAVKNKNFELAYKHWIDSAENGDPSSQFNIAMLYTLGLGKKLLLRNLVIYDCKN